MALKNARLARAENISPEIRLQHHLPEKGLIIIESRNPDLKEKFIAIKEGGIRDYLISSLGDFKEADIGE
jgi:hypothetical protein